MAEDSEAMSTKFQCVQRKSDSEILHPIKMSFKYKCKWQPFSIMQEFKKCSMYACVFLKTWALPDQELNQNKKPRNRNAEAKTPVVSIKPT